jgi:hypothetical protein
MSEITVFISYSHDSDEHRQKVLALSERLRADGITTLLDQYVNGAPPEGWPRWMLDQLDAAASVLVVCTQTYYRRFRGHEEPGKGKGVDWEGALITQEIYDSRSRTLKFVPVSLSAAVENWIPEPLRSRTHHTLTSEKDYQALLDLLLGRAGVEPGPVGTPKPKPRQKGTPLTFDASAPHTRPVDISRIIKYAPDELVGREQEMQALDETWTKVRDATRPRPHVFTFVALGGEGKTSVVAKWAAKLAAADWPGCDAAFAWSFYSQGTREQLAASSDLFLKEALTFFGDPALAGSAQGAFDKGRRLARWLASGGRCSSSTAWSRCNTRPPRPRRASSRTRASRPCSMPAPSRRDHPKNKRRIDLSHACPSFRTFSVSTSACITTIMLRHISTWSTKDTRHSSASRPARSWMENCPRGLSSW